MGSLFSILGGRRVHRITRPPNSPLVTTAPQLEPFPGQFPDELYECIFDNLDEPPLAGGLVCREWRPKFRRRLFSRLELTINKAQRLMPLLDNQSNTLSPHVVELRLTGQLSMQRIGMGMSEQQRNVWRSLGQSLQRVERLELVDVQFDSFDDFMFLVCCFPSLRTILLEYLHWPAMRELATREKFLRTPNQLHVVSLVLNGDAGKDVAEWLLAQNPVPKIDAFHFETYKLLVNHAMRRLIEARGEGMKEVGFSMTFNKDVIKHNIDDSINLGLCINLRRLALEHIVLPHPGFGLTQKIPLWVPVMLNQVASPFLEKVTFTLHILTYEGMGFMNWREMDHILCGPRFAMLKEPVRFCIEVDNRRVVPTEVKKLILADMPLLSSKDKVEFEFLN